ncbi:MAG: hypothetical protein LBH74_06960 [Nitrososphaerota archaeon]|jgi:hypothetical protein|uniref:hypothetical protein n=1 Tax=Candidatus Bathycorpusculum sp. TaxID=2994959 RepID=UPI00282D0A5A|nr:hypothetical protein [Candidatus Termitimicrobium sp.]MCL2432465.1 hypothetical protein [Candidatus Termitimicrobium sp.]MDR0493357.1 hypothetical protein [Nitrososphaerota archaeon]
MKKIFSAVLFALLVCELIFTGITCIGEVHAQSTPKKPAIPEFTATFVAGSYEVSPPFQQWIDPYTGKTMDSTMTTPNYTVDFEEIEIKIKNQKRPDNLEGNELYYAVRTKGNYGEYWQQHQAGEYSGYKQEDGAYTTIRMRAENYPDGGKVDVQVEAMYGYFWYRTDNPITSFYVFEGETSGWSNTKTVTITRDNNETPNQMDPTSNPTHTIEQSELQTEIKIVGLPLTEFILVFILCAVIAALSIALVYRSHKKPEK